MNWRTWWSFVTALAAWVVVFQMTVIIEQMIRLTGNK